MTNPKIPNRRFALNYIKITKTIGFVNLGGVEYVSNTKMSPLWRVHTSEEKWFGRFPTFMGSIFIVL
jgi:hypothetical protein